MDTDLLLNQIESDNVTAKNADYILETPTKSKGYTIAFSGFKEQHPKFSMEFRNHLQTIITKLGGQVHESKDFEDEQILNADITQITHIVVPSLETRTMKTLAAILSQRWLITTDWVMASNTANHFVDEKKYGFKLSEYLFVDKKFYITPKFTQANESNFQAKNCVDLIGYGKGKLVLRSTDKRDFTIIADDETSAFKGTKAMMTFNDLLNLIPQPPNATGISNGFVEPLIRSKKATDEEKENKLVTPDTDGKKNSRRKSAPYNTPKNKTSNLDSEATEEYQKSSSKKRDTKNESKTPLSTRKSGRHTPKNLVFKVENDDLDYEVEDEDNVNSDTDFDISSEIKNNNSSKKRKVASQKESKTARPKKKLKSDE